MSTNNGVKLKTPRLVELRVPVRENHLAALKLVIEDLSDSVGGRLAKSQRLPKEQVLTEAAVALGALRASVNGAVAALART
jgi:hypothetical protein